MPGTTIDVVGVHLWPPESPTKAKWRNAQFAELADIAQQRDRPLMILGDFNSTPWSPVFRQWLQRSDLVYERRSAPLYTWPTWVPLFWIPIDACVTSKELKILSQRRGPRIGSDHYPLIAEVSLI